MKEIVLSLPAFGFIVSTRAALGVGIGLLISERLPVERRRAIGAALVAFGAATTIPAVQTVIRNMGRARRVPAGAGYDAQLASVTRYPRKGDDLY